MYYIVVGEQPLPVDVRLDDKIPVVLDVIEYAEGVWNPLGTEW